MNKSDSRRRPDTNLEPPPLPAVFVSRPALVARLDAAVAHPVTIVSAPAGYGKTTTATAWLQATDARASWITLDDGDNELSSFLQHLIVAVRRHFPAACAHTELLLQLPELPPLEHIKANLVVELADLPGPLVLILDNLHLIHQRQVIELIWTPIEHQLPTIRFLLLVRGEPRLPLPWLRARKRVVEIGTRELAFDQREATDYLKLLFGMEATPDTVTRLVARTEGWVTGLQLLGRDLSNALEDEELAQRGEDSMPRSLVDFFLREVMAGQPAATQSFLQRIAILERFCPPLCDALFLNESHARPQSRALVERLWRSGSFVFSLNDRLGWYRLHALFREVLQLLATAEDPATVARLHERASGWLAENDYVEEALAHAVAAGNLKAAARIVETRAGNLLQQEETALLTRWLRRLPPDLLSQRPALLIAQAWRQQLNQLDAPVESLLSAAEALLDTEDGNAEVESVPVLRGKIAALRSSSCYWQGRPEETQAFAREALALLPANHPLTSHAWGYLILAQRAAWEPDEAFDRLRHTIRSQQIEAPASLSPLLLSQAHLSLYSAKLDQLADVANTLLNYGARFELPLTRAWAHCFLGRIYYERDDLEAASWHFSVVASDPGSVPLDAHVNSLLGLALIHQARGAISASDEVFSELEALEDASTANVAAFRAWLALTRDEADLAISWAETTPVPDVPCCPFLHINPLLVRIRVRIAQGTRESLLEAIRHLLMALRAAQSTGNSLCIVSVLALRSLVLRAQGNEETALDVLERAVNMARQAGMVRSFVDLGLPMADLLYRLVERQEGADTYAEQLLAAFERSAVIHPLSLQANESLVEPLTERELEVLHMLARRLSNIEIAQRLGISPLTVKKHTINIYQKFNVQNRRDAVAAADERGLIVD